MAPIDTWYLDGDKKKPVKGKNITEKANEFANYYRIQALSANKKAQNAQAAAEKEQSKPINPSAENFEKIATAKNPNNRWKENKVQKKALDKQKELIAITRERGSKNLKQNKSLVPSDKLPGLLGEKAAQDKNRDAINMRSGVGEAVARTVDPSRPQSDDFLKKMVAQVNNPDARVRSYGYTAADDMKTATQNVQRAKLAQAGSPDEVRSMIGKSAAEMPDNVVNTLQQIRQVYPELSAKAASKFALAYASDDKAGIEAVLKEIRAIPDKSMLTESIGDVPVEVTQKGVEQKILTLLDQANLDVTPENVGRALNVKNEYGENFFSAGERRMIKGLVGSNNQFETDKVQQIVAETGAQKRTKGKAVAIRKGETKQPVDPFLVPLLLSPVTETVTDTTTGQVRKQGATYLENIYKDNRYRKLDAGQVQLGMLNPQFELPTQIADKYGYYRTIESNTGRGDFVGVPTQDPLQQAVNPRYDPSYGAGGESKPMTLGQAMTQILLEGRTNVRDFAPGELIQKEGKKGMEYYLPDSSFGDSYLGIQNSPSKTPQVTYTKRRTNDLLNQFIPNRIDGVSSGTQVYPTAGNPTESQLAAGTRSYRIGKNFIYSNESLRKLSDLVEAITLQTTGTAYRPTINEPLAADDWRLKKLQGMLLLDTTPKVLGDRSAFPSEVLDVLDRYETAAFQAKSVNPNWKPNSQDAFNMYADIFNPGGSVWSDQYSKYPLAVLRKAEWAGESALPKWQGQMGLINTLLNRSGSIVPDPTTAESSLPAMIMASQFTDGKFPEGSELDKLNKIITPGLEYLTKEQKKTLVSLAQELGPEAIQRTAADPQLINPSTTAEAMGAVSGTTNPQTLLGAFKGKSPQEMMNFLLRRKGV